jgi:hypothetical protein
MIPLLAIGLLAMTICLAFQAAAAAAAARYFAGVTGRPMGPNPRIYVFRQFAALMLVLMAGNIIQVLVWAELYNLLNVFPDFETATYFSGVTFTSLGYGDVVLPRQVRLLAPLQAANGLIMFGISTALFFAAIQSVTVKWAARRAKKDSPDGPF